MIKRLFLTLVIFLITLTGAWAAENVILPSQLGIVQNVEYVDIESELSGIKQQVEIKLLKGDLRGKLISIDNMLTGNPYYDIKVKKGTKVILHVEDEGDGLVFSIEDIKRSNTLVWLSALFLGLLLYVGKLKGLYSFIAIVITASLIFWLLSPMVLFGINPILGALVISLLSTSATMYLVGGINRKSSSAVIGCTLSLIIAVLLSFLTIKTASLTGFNDETTVFLFAAHPELNFIALTTAAIMLATLGAVMDVAMSIASTINEIHTLNPEKTIKELFQSGMNVGRDIIGTMANTLILVYLGGSLPLLLLASNIDMQKFFNLNQVVTEISSAIIGSCAIVICVPITAIVTAKLTKHKATD